MNEGKDEYLRLQTRLTILEALVVQAIGGRGGQTDERGEETGGKREGEDG